MALPKSRSEFKEYCLRKLGKPVLNINVADEQTEDRIDEALEMFLRYHVDGSTEDYIVYEVTQADIDSQSITLPNNILNVGQVFLKKTNQSGFDRGIFDVEFQIQQSDYLNAQGIYNFSSSGLSNYYLIKRQLNLLERMFIPDYSFAFNRIKNVIKFKNSLKFVGQKVVLKAYTTIRETDGTISDIEIWADDWLRDYSTALIKRQWGENMKKFQGVQLIGGVTMDGKTIFDEAQEEIRELEEALKNQFQEPCDFFIG